MMLRVKNLIKNFAGGVQAVKGISFEVGEGEFYTLLGPSGCGKTTTLRSIAGLETPDGGEISIGDTKVFSKDEGILIPVHQRGIGMVFQSYAIWPHLSVFNNVAFPLKHSSRGVPKSEIRERVLKALSLVQLDGLANRPAPFLSGGQQQRVALARALIYEPKLLLLDEPLSNLDAKLREEMRIELKLLVKRLGITTLYVTHDQVEALALSDQVAVMNKGVIIQEGAPREIYLQPRDAFTANFIGKVNLYEGNVVRSPAENGLGVVQVPIGEVLCRMSDGLMDGDAIQLMIRPEGVDILEYGLEKNKNMLDGEVELVTFQGDTVEYQVRVQSQHCRVKSDSVKEIGKDRKVNLYFPPERCLVVRRESHGSQT
jgi:iron(III) transport system ATP-binding protein